MPLAARLMVASLLSVRGRKCDRVDDSFPTNITAGPQKAFRSSEIPSSFVADINHVLVTPATSFLLFSKVQSLRLEHLTSHFGALLPSAFTKFPAKLFVEAQIKCCGIFFFEKLDIHCGVPFGNVPFNSRDGRLGRAFRRLMSTVAYHSKMFQFKW
jgi:hypothetical protein